LAAAVATCGRPHAGCHLPPPTARLESPPPPASLSASGQVCGAVSRTGSCLTTGSPKAGSLPLKLELVDASATTTAPRPGSMILAWVAWYNRSRLHSANGHLSPSRGTPARHHQPIAINHGPHDPGMYPEGRSTFRHGSLCRRL
jgi:hypothetical protein